MVPGVLAFHGEKCQILTPSGIHEGLPFTLIPVLPLYKSSSVEELFKYRCDAETLCEKSWLSESQ